MWLLVVFVFVLPLLSLGFSLYVLFNYKRFAAKLARIALLNDRDPVNG